MIVKYTLAPHEVQNILLAHIEKLCGLKPDRDEYVSVLRVGGAPAAFEATAEVRRNSVDER